MNSRRGTLKSFLGISPSFARNGKYRSDSNLNGYVSSNFLSKYFLCLISSSAASVISIIYSSSLSSLPIIGLSSPDSSLLQGALIACLYFPHSLMWSSEYASFNKESTFITKLPFLGLPISISGIGNRWYYFILDRVWRSSIEGFVDGV